MSTNENCHYFLMPTISVRFRRVRFPTVWQIASVLQCWCDRAAQRRRLAQLEDRMLKDIGVSKADAYRESSKMFWQD